MREENVRKKAYENGLRDGFKEGVIQGKKMCADEMLKLGISLKIIKQITKLSIKEIMTDYNKN